MKIYVVGYIKSPDALDDIWGYGRIVYTGLSEFI